MRFNTRLTKKSQKILSLLPSGKKNRFLNDGIFMRSCVNVGIYEVISNRNNGCVLFLAPVLHSPEDIVAVGATVDPKLFNDVEEFGLSSLSTRVIGFFLGQEEAVEILMVKIGERIDAGYNVYNRDILNDSKRHYPVRIDYELAYEMERFISTTNKSRSSVISKIFEKFLASRKS